MTTGRDQRVRNQCAYVFLCVIYVSVFVCPLKGILGFEERPLVSTDYVNDNW